MTGYISPTTRRQSGDSKLKKSLQPPDCKVTFIYVLLSKCFYLCVPTRKHAYFYKRNNLKHATGFLSPDDYAKLKQLAKDADKSLARYVSRLLEKHIHEQWAEKEEPIRRPPNNEPINN